VAVFEIEVETGENQIVLHMRYVFWLMSFNCPFGTTLTWHTGIVISNKSFPFF